ncbi:PIG-L family deacetylase [Actinomycetospora sp. NBRC 106378]|uniref:PIG-L deacetylase family protein n=1 Tax=Actinomycetospora sp. NBRC 106378 TaxID=3032208 RepID=UPI0024A1500D|nr:PIG-L family deacetylase [Actinomycetospora sp. NBRC 106378]GLZ55721.1 acetylglucosaminylphosphatidylinositol deacetylase [Actinomycetospora sp. NBRC 106378]
MTPRDLTGTGTSEQDWQASGVLAALPRVTPADVRPAGRVVVLAPHPDDETLGVGATLATWARAGAAVTVLAVTDGEASHPGSPTLSPARLVERRVAERTAALHRLGLAGAPVVRAGLPDGGVADRRADLAALLTDLVSPGDTLLAPVPGDGHPDHDAVADVAADAGVPVLGYAVWWWHWAAAGELPPGAVVIGPDEAAREAKRDAVSCFRTQVEPLSDHPADAAILPPPVLERLLRHEEVLWR